MQALILVGGEGTRLRPLTSTMPKPVVPLVGKPFMVYMLEWLRSHGVDDVILSCGFLADGVRQVLGGGSALGLQIRYVEEPTPLGTAGALKYAEKLLDERFLMLNGDVLTDLDLTAQLAQHQQTGARATLALMGVEDPSAYGLVRRAEDFSVTGFLEKPSPEEIDTNLVNAGAYILERSVLDRIAPAGEPSSIERDVFPLLVGDGLFGHATEGYWLDIGTPDRYLQATADILSGAIKTQVGAALAQDGGRLVDPRAEISGQLLIPVVAAAGVAVAEGACAGPGTVLGEGVRLQPGARVERSTLLERVVVGENTHVRDAIISRDVTIGANCVIEDGVVIGQGVTIGAGNTLAAGARIFPGVDLPEGAIRF